MKKYSYILIGALTSKPYAFTARSWELKNIETIDLFDSLCSNIRIDIRSSEILRVLPIGNKYINNEWISDKTRYAYDGLKRWRFINPLIKKDNIFINSSWEEVFSFLKAKLNKSPFQSITINTGNFCDLETITALIQFSNQFNNVILNGDLKINGDKQNYFINNNEFLESIFGNKIFIFVGINLRVENPVLNIKIRKLSQLQNKLIIYIGSKFDYNFNLIHAGNHISVLLKILQGKSKLNNILISFIKKEKVNSNLILPISVIFGNEIMTRASFPNLISTLETCRILPYTFTFKYCIPFTGKINALELGFYNNKQNFLVNRNNNLIYLIGAEDYALPNKDDFIIFQGHHNDKIRDKFNIILPSLNWTEKSSIYLNIFGTIQKSNFVINSPVHTRVDWKIIRILSIVFNKDIKFNTIKELHQMLNTLTPNINKSILKYNLTIESKINFKKYSIKKIKSTVNPFKSYLVNFYQNSAVERASKIMTNCSNILYNKKRNFNK